MVINIAELLKGFIDEEIKKLDEFDIKHKPTIGEMYEGLTHDIINRMIPKELDLTITHGFITEESGRMTGEIDCMLVKGEGTQVPYTDKYKWHVKNVIAVLEVKKNLYSNELSNSYFHLLDVLDSYSRYIKYTDPDDETIDIKPVYRAFAQITGKICPSYYEVDKLSIAEQVIFHTLVMDFLSPVRIAIGYHGFKDELSYREAMLDMIENNLESGLGIKNIPQLIISDRFSLVKGNGFPYLALAKNKSKWKFYFSSSENPLVFILEFIWYKLQRIYKLEPLWSEDHIEGLNPFLSGKIATTAGKTGWEYNYISLTKSQLKEAKAKEWEPVSLNRLQCTVINILCGEKTISLDDSDFVNHVESQGCEVDSFIEKLLTTGLVALNGQNLELITDSCQIVFMPNGTIVANNDNSVRLQRWLNKQLK